MERTVFYQANTFCGGQRGILYLELMNSLYLSVSDSVDT